ncbi:MAG TPA: MFS transporter [Rectinemataceae bacterium]|nr:MFS transporter [Rectinemataceae bacterium]
MRRAGSAFAALLSANGLAMAGTSMSMLALPWLVLSATGSAMDAGLVAFAEMLPYVLVQALGGPFVDRWDKRRVGILTDIIAAIAMGAAALWALSSGGTSRGLGLSLLLALMAIVGASRGAGSVAKRVLIPKAAAPIALPLERASGLYEGVNRVATLLGGPLAGLLMAASSAGAVLALDAASFGASALILALGMPGEIGRSGEFGEPGLKEGTEAAERPSSYFAELVEGFVFLGRDRLLFAIGILLVVTNLLDQAYAAVLMPLWMKTELNSPLALGMVVGIFGAGAVAGNGLMTWLAPRLPRRLPFALGFLVGGAPRFLILAFASSLGPVVFVALVAGMGAGGINPALGAVEFERVPARLQARVLGALGSLAWAGIPLGGLAGGALAGAVGLRGSLAGFGFVYLLATLAPFVFPVWRQMERKSGIESDEMRGTMTTR